MVCIEIGTSRGLQCSPLGEEKELLADVGIDGGRGPVCEKVRGVDSQGSHQRVSHNDEEGAAVV